MGDRLSTLRAGYGSKMVSLNLNLAVLDTFNVLLLGTGAYHTEKL